MRKSTRITHVLGLCVLTVSLLAVLRVYLAGEVPYSTVLGTPGLHTTGARLPDLAMALVFEEERDRILALQDDGAVVAWGVTTGQRQAVARTESLFAYCRSGQRLAVSRTDHVVLLDLAGGATRRVEGMYDHAAWSEDCGTLVLAARASRLVEIWDARGVTRRDSVATAAPVRNGLALSADGRYLAAAEGTYDESNGHRTMVEIFVISGDGAPSRSTAMVDPDTALGMWTMVFAPDARSLVVDAQVDARSGLRNLAPDTGRLLWAQGGFASYWVRALAVSPDGALLATGDEAGTLRLWDLESGRQRAEVDTGLVVQALSFSENGRRLAFALWDATIGVIEVHDLFE